MFAGIDIISLINLERFIIQNADKERNEMSLEVLKFELSMLDKCVDLFIDTFSKEPWNDEYESRDVVVDFIKNHYKNNYFLGYVAKMENEIVGLSIGFTKPWICGMEYYIDEFCIKYDLQNKGIGSVFMEKIEKDLKEKGINGEMLITDKDFPSHKFYSKNGFGVMEDSIALVKGI